MPLSNIFSPISLSGIAQSLGLERPKGMEALAPHGLVKGWTQVGKYNAKVDHRLVDSLAKAAERFVADHPGYTVEAFSGYRPGDKRQHGKGRAVDVRIKDPAGNEIKNYQNAESFRTYETLAQHFKSVVDEDYPDLADKARWGGYFGGPPGKYGAADLMHFDLGGLSGLGMLGGSWDKGLTDKQRSLFPGAVSVGLGQLGGFTTDAVPTPTARPDPTDLAGLNALQDKREYERPTFSAPLGQVDRAALPDLPSVPSISPRDIARQAVNAPVDAMGGLGSSLARNAVGMAAPPTPASWSPQQAISDLASKVAPSVNTSFAPPSNFAQSPAVAPTPASPMRPDNLDYAGPKGLFGVAPNLTSPDMMGPPSSFNAPAPAFASPPTEISNNVISPVPGAPASSVVAPTGAFPEAPPGPSTFSKIKDVVSPIASNAMLGLKVGGPIGAIAAPALGLIGDRLGIGLSHLGAGFDNAVQDRFSTGFGTAGIMGAMGGPKGAQGFSLSNPGSSFTSLGNGMGLRRSDKFGWTEVVGPSGSVVGIKYDDPDKKGIFGKISNSMNGKFGGGLSEKGSKAIAGGKGGLY